MIHRSDKFSHLIRDNSRIRDRMTCLKISYAASGAAMRINKSWSKTPQLLTHEHESSLCCRINRCRTFASAELPRHSISDNGNALCWSSLATLTMKRTSGVRSRVQASYPWAGDDRSAARHVMMSPLATVCSIFLQKHQ